MHVKTDHEATISINGVKPSQYKLFSCGEPELDAYLKRYTKGNEKREVARSFLLLSEDQEVIGYYTLCMAQIDFEELPEIFQKGIPKYPIPVARLCRLAVDRRMQGLGIGEHLLMDAIQRVVNASHEVAVHSLIVDAKHIRAKNFYLRYDFIPLKDQDLKLFLPLNTLQAL